MPSSLLRQVLELGRSRRRGVIAATVLLLVVAAGLVTRVHFLTDVLDLVPQTSRAVTSFRAFVETFGGLDELYVLLEAPEGREITEYGDLVAIVVAALEAAPEVESVDASLLDADKDWSYLFDRVFLLRGEHGAEDELRKLTPSGIASELAHLRANVSLLPPSSRALVQGDPLGLTRAIRDRFARSKAFGAFDPLAEGYVSRDRRLRMVIVRPAAPPFDTAFSRRLMERLETIREESLERFAVMNAERVGDDEEALPPPRIDFAGAHRVSLEAERLIRGEMWRNAVVSLVLILGAVFLFFRSYWVLVTATLVLGLAGLLAMSAVGLARGGLLAAASGGAAMLFGLGIDGVMVLYARHLELRSETASPGLVGTAFAVLLGNVTSVATFAALTWIDFPSLEEIGRLVGLGMLFCCLLTLVLVPAFWSLRSGASSRSSARAPSFPALSRFVAARARLVLALAGAVTLVALVGLARFTVRTDVAQLRPDTPGNAVGDELQERFAFPTDVAIVTARGPELEPLLELHHALEASLEQDPDVPSINGPTFLLPPRNEQARVRQLLARFAPERSALPSRIEDAAATAGFRPGTFAPFLSRLERLLDPDNAITYEGLLEHGLGALIGRHVALVDGTYVTASYLYPRDGVDPLALAGKVETVSPRFETTGLTIVNAEVAAGFPFQLARGVALGAFAVFVLVYASFGSVKRALLCLAPTVLGILWSVGALAHLGYRFDLFGAFAFIMVIGIGVDYGIHVLERHATEGSASSDYLSHTAGAISLAAITTMIGFGTLLGSSYAPMSSLGLVTVVSVLAVTLTSLVVLPAWLEVLRTSA